MEEKCDDELKVLKEFIIENKILMNRRDDDWWIEKKRNNFQWIKREGMLLLLTEEIIDLVVDKPENEVLELFDDFFWTTSVSSREVQCSLVQFCISVNDRMSKNQWNRDRVMCWVVGWMLERFHVKWSDETVDCLVNYLVKLLECDEMEIVKWAILTMEILSVKMQLSIEQKDRLCKAITQHTTLTEIFTEFLDFKFWDAKKYQVKWCARWCNDNLIEGNRGDIPEIKLSTDRFEARSDLNCSPVRSSFPTIKSNVYFYEVICVTNGNIKLGWTTRDTRIDIFEEMDNDKYSIGLQIGDECFIQHNDQRQPISASLCSINVVGCMLDLDNRRFGFYINGRTLECPIPPNLSPQPYFATALLSTHQQCHFNFGQSPFKYPPSNNKFTTFDGQCGGDTKKYRLVETENWGGDFWFKHALVDNQVGLFCDELQNEFGREVRRVVGDIENDRDICELRLKNLEVEKGWRGVRFILAIIEVLGKVDRGYKIDVIAQWVGHDIENIIDEVYKPKLLELIYPYLQHLPTESTFTQHRSICLVLLHLIKCCHHYSYCFMDPIHSSVFNYLTRTLTSTSDEWTQLFVLISLTDFEMSEADKLKIESCVKIGKMIKRWRNQFEGKNVAQLLNSDSKSVDELRIQYQLYQCSTNFLTSSTPPNPNPDATLNPNDLSPQLNLSPCRLSARSDWHWQSVRSMSQVSSHIYYFEVILLTSGPMTIGWATKRTELVRTEVGSDEFSLGFDGYNRWIRHENNPLKIETIPRWKPGDVIGCLLNQTNYQFAFTLNGHSLPLPLNIYFSSLPYHACVSLSSHQQVYFNFGQTSFKYPPKRIDYLDFHQFSTFSANQTNSSSSISFTKSVILSNYTSANVAPISSLPTECQLCREKPESTLLRFVCCDTLSFCRDCVDRIDDCPKCKKKIKRNPKRPYNDTN